MSVDKFRPGKTERDKRTGAWDNRFHNRSLRVDWQHDSNSSNKNFPFKACNGKKNRQVKRRGGE